MTKEKDLSPSEAALEMIELVRNEPAVLSIVTKMLTKMRDGSYSEKDCFNELLNLTSNYIFLFRVIIMLRESIDDDNMKRYMGALTTLFAFIDMEELAIESAILLNKKE